MRRAWREQISIGAIVVVAALTPGAVLGVQAADADRPGSSSRSRSLTGIVVDDATGEPVAGAAVRIEGLPGTLTDEEGRFAIEGMDDRPRELRVRQFGYAGITVAVVAPALPDVLVEIPLAREPIAIEGLGAVVDRLAVMKHRLESRRRAVPAMVRAFDQERLLRSGAPTVYDFLVRQPAVHPIPCVVREELGMCMLRRGRVIRPSVFIDELPAFGGMDELSSYDPGDLYLVEVYSSGVEIRAYTLAFMERMARRPIALLPVLTSTAR